MMSKVRVQRSRLASGSALAVVLTAMMLAPQQAHAQDECGAPVNGVVTCTAAGNPYPNGVTYDQSGDLSVTINADTKITNTLHVGGSNGPGGIVTLTNNGTITIARATVPNSYYAAAIDVGGGLVAPGGSFFGYGVDSADIESPGSISIQGPNAVGINAYASGAVIINAGDVTAMSTNANSFGPGIDVFASMAMVSFNNVTSSSDGVSILTFGASGDIDVTGVNVTSGGASRSGVYTQSLDVGGRDSDVSVKISGTISSTGPASFGVFASAYGDATVAVNNVNAGAFGVLAEGDNALVQVNGAVAVSGTSPGLNANFSEYNNQFIDGVLAIGYGETGTATVVNNGSISAAGDDADAMGAHAIIAIGNGGVTISGSGAASTIGAGSDAIQVLSSRAIAISQGSVSTTGDNSNGIVAKSTIIEPVAPRGTILDDPDNPPPVVLAPGEVSGPVSVTVTSVTSKGVNASGIIASSDTDAVTVNAGTIAVSGSGSKGVVATGAGPVSVTSGAASAKDSTVIAATSSAGAVSVTLNGVTTTGSGPAVQASGATTAALALGSAGTLTAAGGGATLTSATGSTLTNAGTITGNATTAIVTATGGALTFTNSGRFTGLVGFTAGDDRVTNSGTYTALADQDFGAGTNSFANSGTLAVLAGASAAGTVHLSNLQSFANTGLIDLRNGHAGDVLNLSGTFTGSGGSTLGIDIGGGAIDKLVVGGAITGSTLLVVNRVNGVAAAVAGNGTVFAVGGEGSSPTAFTIIGAQNSAFVRFGITFDAVAESYALSDGPTDAVFRTVRIGEGAQQLWYKSSDAWSAHMEELRDSAGGARATGSGRVWGQITGQTDSRTGSQAFAAAGRSIDLSYKQDAFGGQLGVDLGQAGGPLTFGVTGGYLNSSLNYRNVAERTKYDSINVGVYASYAAGGLFANVLGKYDYIWLDTTSQPAGYSAKYHGNSYGAQGEVGYRFGSAGFYAEPLVSIAYVRTDLNDLHALDATFDFEPQDGLRGKAGLRVGSKVALGRGAVMTVYAQGSYVHEFRGEGGVTFTEGATVIGFRDQPIGDYGQGKLGFSVATPGGVTGFIEGFGDASDRYKGGGGRAGIRLAF
jgi:outer membrane autotransporter protein